MQQLRDRVAVVTGAASGIGRATALRFAREGCVLALVDIDSERLAEVANEIESLGGKATLHEADVADAERMRALASEVETAHGEVHIIVNNAGVSVLKDFEEHTLEDFQWLVGINYWGVVHGCMFFLPILKRADEAHIVNISSMFGFVGIPGQSSYCSTKFAVRGLTESLASELEGTTVGVTSIHPGGIATGIVRSIRARDQDAKAQLQESFDRYGHPPEQVADAIVKAIRKGKLRAIVGVEAYLAEWLKRLSPVGFQRMLARRMRVPGS